MGEKKDRDSTQQRGGGEGKECRLLKGLAERKRKKRKRSKFLLDGEREDCWILKVSI